MAALELKPHPLQDSIKAWCTNCWKDRTITTNAKCRVCGTKLTLRKHWKQCLVKLDLILEQPYGMVGLEIKDEMYFITPDKLFEFKRIEKDNYAERIKFIEQIRKECKPFKI